MKITLSNGATGGGPCPRSSYCARPDRNGLYGKKPVEKVISETGMRMLARVSSMLLVENCGAMALCRRSVSLEYYALYMGVAAM